MSDQLYETLKQTATAHIHGYESPTPFNNEAIQKLRTPECVHYLHPIESIPSPFNEAIKIEQFAQFMTFFGPCLDKCEMRIKETTVDVRTRKVVMILNTTFDFKTFGEEPKEEGYTTEYMLLMEMEESGTKIVRVEEFMDPQRVMGHVASRAEQYRRNWHNRPSTRPGPWLSDEAEARLLIG